MYKKKWWLVIFTQKVFCVFPQSTVVCVCTGWRGEMGQQVLCNKAKSWGERWASFRKSRSVGTWGISISSRKWSQLRDYPVTRLLHSGSITPGQLWSCSPSIATGLCWSAKMTNISNWICYLSCRNCPGKQKTGDLCKQQESGWVNKAPESNVHFHLMVIVLYYCNWDNERPLILRKYLF